MPYASPSLLYIRSFHPLNNCSFATLLSSFLTAYLHLLLFFMFHSLEISLIVTCLHYVIYITFPFFYPVFPSTRKLFLCSPSLLFSHCDLYLLLFIMTHSFEPSLITTFFLSHPYLPFPVSFHPPSHRLDFSITSDTTV